MIGLLDKRSWVYSTFSFYFKKNTRKKKSVPIKVLTEAGLAVGKALAVGCVEITTLQYVSNTLPAFLLLRLRKYKKIFP